MNYIIPILSDGYFHNLCNLPEMYNTGCLDEQYIKLIHDHMSKYYSDNRCRNDKFRCIIPDRFKHSVFKHPHMKIDPVFRAYFPDSPDEIEKLVLRLATAKRQPK